MTRFTNSTSLLEFNDIGLYVTLCQGLSSIDSGKLMNMFTETTVIYNYLFVNPIFKEIKDGVNTLELILPSVKRVYSKFFINQPELIKDKNNPEYLELFTHLFDLKEFLENLKKMYIENYNCLDKFDNLDKSSEILTLIIEDYVSSKLAFVRNIKKSDLISEIRSIKLSKHLDI